MINFSYAAMSLEKNSHVKHHRSRSFNNDDYKRGKCRLSRHARPKSYVFPLDDLTSLRYNLLPLDDFTPPIASSSEKDIQGLETGQSKSLKSLDIPDIDVDNLDDSFQKEVAEKTQMYFVGKQEAEVEVLIDRLVGKKGNKDKALLHVVSEIDNENKVQVLVNTLLHRGANPSSSNSELKTALHFAVEKNLRGVQVLVNTLLHRGANPSSSNSELKTALHFAVEKNLRGVCSKLLDNDAYPDARDRNGDMPYTLAYEKGNDTIAAMLISYMRNREVRRLYTSDGLVPSEFSFHELMKKNMQSTMLAVLDSLIECENPSGHMTVYYHILDADETGRVPTQDGFNPNSKSALQLIAKSGNKTLVYHDVVRLLIRRKWKEYARSRFLLNSVFYLVTLLALTYSVVVAVSSKNPLVYDTPLHIIRAITEVWSCIMAFQTLVSEINQLRKHKLEYWHDAFNWLDLSSAILILVVIPLRISKLNEQWPVAAVAFLLWTLRIFKYASVIRQTGAYAQILWRILVNDFIQFTIVFSVILLAFSGAFILSLKGDDAMSLNDETSSFWKILFLGIRILTEAEGIIEYSELRPMSCIIMLMFLFTCCVILLNILIAQLSDTYQNVQQDAQRGLEVNRAWIVARVELNSMYLCKDHRKTHYIESEHIKDIREVLERWETPPLNEMNRNIQDIYDSLDSHKLNLMTVRNRLARQESTLYKIQEQLELLVNLQTANRKPDTLSDLEQQIQD